MPTGKIKWFNPDKGFGFIAQDGSNQDAFVHWTAVEGLGNYERMREGEPVSYEVERTDRGLMAVNVKRLEQEEAY
jgi:CspA family cold shock protein